WQNPAVVKKIHELSPTLPHLQDLLLVFFKGAAETWERFTSEFAPGGLIDEATTEEKELAWMPATNDVNEGALGSFRHLMRYQPQLTLLNHNALAMFFRNNTQAFMAAKFTEAVDYQHLHKLGREKGDEKQRRKEIVEHCDRHQAEKTARKEKREQKALKGDSRSDCSNRHHSRQSEGFSTQGYTSKGSIESIQECWSSKFDDCQAANQGC
ncbi:hypothetical protein BYT27DRAFT_7088815, partial [Phlegmacium glaucopus]